eukprot:Polyplicarium_translucidae@DN3354_c5_g3_i7.p1
MRIMHRDIRSMHWDIRCMHWDRCMCPKLCREANSDMACAAVLHQIPRRAEDEDIFVLGHDVPDEKTEVTEIRVSLLLRVGRDARNLRRRQFSNHHGFATVFRHLKKLLLELEATLQREWTCSGDVHLSAKPRGQRADMIQSPSRF